MSSIDAGSVLRERLIFLRSPYLYVCPAIFALYVAVECGVSFVNNAYPRRYVSFLMPIDTLMYASGL
jgi:hypothetical protein